LNKVLVELTVNGEKHSVAVKPNTSLLKLLRDELNLIGTKHGCGTGECGACTVLMNGDAVNSCLVLALDAAGTEIITIEGLTRDGLLDPVQKSFIEHGAIQCGYCTPGMIMSAKDYLSRVQKPTEAQAREAISGNLCRCTGYIKIIEAIMEAHKYE
jgi:carbon-monoxide dehydrogenase small subunit